MAQSTVHYDGQPISREEAAEAGDKLFFTGVPCRNGHVAQRWVANACCRECARLNSLRHTARDPERTRERSKRYRAANLEKTREAVRRYQRENRDMLRAKAKLYQAGQKIRSAEYKRLFKARKAGRPKPTVCDLCRQKSGKICFDHCHVTGAFRGWLCDTCNSALGFANDDPVLLRRMARYLEKSKEPSLL